jgi:hypothetical protein
MDILLLKLVLTPLLIGAVTLVSRRWGPAAGGLLAGLPLTSGPISLYLALERGPIFAAQAATGTLLGNGAIGVFCIAHAWVATRAGWPGSLAVGLTAYLVAMYGLSAMSVGLLAAFVGSVGFLLACLWAMPVGSALSSQAAASRWDLPARMIVATTLVVAITGAADRLGPHLSGLLSPIPVFIVTITVFAHRQQGAAAAIGTLTGVLYGAVAFASFFLVIGLVAGRVNLTVTFALACVASAAAQWSTTVLRKWKGRPPGRP